MSFLPIICIRRKRKTRFYKKNEEFLFWIQTKFSTNIHSTCIWCPFFYFNFICTTINMNTVVCISRCKYINAFFFSVQFVKDRLEYSITKKPRLKFVFIAIKISYRRFISPWTGSRYGSSFNRLSNWGGTTSLTSSVVDIVF